MLARINDRFTDLADTVSSATGRWPTTAVALVLIVLWFATGPLFQFSDTWQLLVNTPTTIVELFLGFLACASSNRVERRNRELHLAVQAIVEQVDGEEQRELGQLDDLLTRLTRMEQAQGTLFAELVRRIDDAHTSVLSIVSVPHLPEPPGPFSSLSPTFR